MLVKKEKRKKKKRKKRKYVYELCYVVICNNKTIETK